MIPLKNREWHGFILEEGENIDKNYELKKHVFIILPKNILQLLFWSSKWYRSFSLSHNKKKDKSKANQWKKLKIMMYVIEDN